MVLRADSGRGVPGAKLLLREDGSTHGTLGDAGLDALALDAARRVADLGTNEHLMTDDGTELYVEGFTTPPTLVLMGGGHVAKATYDLALLLKYRIYVVDDRVEFANRERFPGAEDTIVVSDYARGLDQVPINANTFIAIATRGHWFDDLALEAAIRTPAKYVGLMGSTRKTILIYQRLAGMGIPIEKLRQVHAPIGLDIGALTPEEIAVSIMSEIVMFRHGASGGPLIMDDKYFDRAISKAVAAEAAPD
jgi:xanthine dehydrogenase accessory factor